MHDVVVSRRDPWLLAAVGIGIMVAVGVVVCRPWDLANGFMIGAPIGRDFANLWLGGQLALEGKLDLLIDLPAYEALFSATFAHNPADTFVFSYPPHSLLFIAPFAALPFAPAVYAWTLINLVCVERSVRLMRDDWKLAAAACLSPAALTMVAFGHFGGMLALLVTYVLTRAERRPVLAGACLALMTVKPQIALIFAILLMLTGRWRAVLWSVPATLLLVAASVLVFGVRPWVNFITWTVPFHSQLVSGSRVGALGMVISVYSGLLLADLPGRLAQIVQCAFSIVVMAKAVQLLNRRGPEPRTIALAVLAALAALPYVNSYDLAIAAPALTLALFDERREPFLPGWAAAALWLVPAFSIPFGLMRLPVVQPVFAVALLFALFKSAAHSRPVLSAGNADAPAQGQLTTAIRMDLRRRAYCALLAGSRPGRRGVPLPRCTPSSASRRSLVTAPPKAEKPPILRPAASTRWQGMMMGTGLWPIACPTARAAPGEPASRARSP